uniref:Inhibitory synaptic factor 2A n=1 Tax=Knipowitschia caucasica TaxID=637954 RepID=A0AAV2LK65_KNICA
MVSKEGAKCMLTNSESDSEAAPAPSVSMALEKYSLEASRQVRKRNKALQVRFKDICEAQNEQREAELQAARKAGKPISYKAAYRKYMTVPARRSIPNVTRSTGVQTSPDLKKHYQTFPFERKKGHTFKHVAAVETYRGGNNGVMVDGKHSQTDLDEDEEEGGACGGVRRTRALLHNECVTTVEQHMAPDGLCSELLLSCSVDADRLPDAQDYQLCNVPKPRTGLQQAEQRLHLEEGSSHTLPDRASRVSGPITWNSLTEVECLDSPSVRSKRKKALQLNGLQPETLPRAGGCTTQAQCHSGRLSAPPLSSPPPDSTQNACKQIVPLNQDGEVKAQLQAMENLISSSQETIKVLLGVIQELEKGEAHREG